jgi:hypothetical protein
MGIDVEDIPKYYSIRSVGVHACATDKTFFNHSTRSGRQPATI